MNDSSKGSSSMPCTILRMHEGKRCILKERINQYTAQYSGILVAFLSELGIIRD